MARTFEYAIALASLFVRGLCVGVGLFVGVVVCEEVPVEG